MFVLRSWPKGRAADASVDTDGTAFDLRRSAHGGYMVSQVVVKADVLCFVGVGPSATPPAPTTSNTSYHEPGIWIYTLARDREEELYFYVYATSGTADVRVSMMV